MKIQEEMFRMLVAGKEVSIKDVQNDKMYIFVLDLDLDEIKKIVSKSHEGDLPPGQS